jgi:glycosyltransferase involved in cell wall biosynthesis
MISVVMPAHDEAAVIRRGLEYLLAGAAPGELEVIVACNGCTDETAAIARQFGPPVRVLEIPTASKIAALNAADAVATAFPRVYMDADVRIDIAGVRQLAAVLNEPGILLAAPRLRMDLRHTTWMVRAFYKVWTRLPYNRTMVGTGVYALSAAGRGRFGEFPNIIADDGFVRFHFRPEERRTAEAAEVWVDPPRSLAGLLRIKTRARLGQYELRRKHPELRGADAKSPGALLGVLLKEPALWPHVPAYFAINLATRWRARRRQDQDHTRVWGRDDSRTPSLTGTPTGTRSTCSPTDPS